MTRLPQTIVFVATLALSLLLSGCSSTYYKALEGIGIPKRELMVHRVEKARDTQEETKEQFQTALEKFKAIANFDGGELEDKYNQLNSEFEASEEQADEVKKRISDIENVSEALFEEWEEELDQYESASLRRNSAKKLSATRQHYAKMIATMKRAESKMEPVLRAFRDQVLYLKHNLNAKAIASLQDEVTSVESDIAVLINSMEKSINEANAFIQTMG
ncbi:MAG: DUF2959 domain-containing protein [Methylococcales bacterium]